MYEDQRIKRNIFKSKCCGKWCSSSRKLVIFDLSAVVAVLGLRALFLLLVLFFYPRVSRTLQELLPNPYSVLCV